MRVTNAPLMAKGIEIGTYTGQIRVRQQIAAKDVVFNERIPPRYRSTQFTVIRIGRLHNPPHLIVLDSLVVSLVVTNT